MKIENLKPATSVPAPAAPSAGGAPANPLDPQQMERQSAEIALLNARVQHLELVVETARSLMSSNQERLLRRLYELPHEIAELSAQLRRLDGPQGKEG